MSSYRGQICNNVAGTMHSGKLKHQSRCPHFRGICTVGIRSIIVCAMFYCSQMWISSHYG